MRQKWCLCVHDEVCSREGEEEQEQEEAGEEGEVVVVMVVMIMVVYMEDSIRVRDAAVRVCRRGKGG